MTQKTIQGNADLAKQIRLRRSELGLTIEEAAAFERIRLLRFLYFCDSEVSGSGIRMDDLKGFPDKSPIREGDRHPCKIGADIEADREVRRTAVNPCK